MHSPNIQRPRPELPLMQRQAQAAVATWQLAINGILAVLMHVVAGAAVPKQASHHSHRPHQERDPGRRLTPQVCVMSQVRLPQLGFHRAGWLAVNLFVTAFLPVCLPEIQQHVLRLYASALQL